MARTQRPKNTLTLFAILLCAGGALLRTQAAAAGASLKMPPSAGVYEVGGLVDVSFVLDTGGEAVNAVNADIQFPADKLQVVNPAASTSFISVWVTAPTYSNTDGVVNFQGGLPNPGINTSAGVISTVTFRVKAPGKAVLRYKPTSKVLRNDGDGTNILTATGTAELTLKPAPPAGPVVNSPTHGDANQWYNNSQVQFSWEAVPNAVGYSYTFDQTAKSIPDDEVETADLAATMKATTDGVWYFHIKAKTESWGGVTTVPVQIDATPPASFTPSLDKTLLTTEETGTLRFLTTDAASGLDHYEVKQITHSSDGAAVNTLFVESASPYVIARLPAGDYEFVVRAIDRAGNTTDGVVPLRVVAGGLPFYARTPFFRNPALANGALIGLLVLVLITLGILIFRRVRIQATFRHDYQVLEHDAQRKYQALQREMEELRRAQGVFGKGPPQPPSSSPPPA